MRNRVALASAASSSAFFGANAWNSRSPAYLLPAPPFFLATNAKVYLNMLADTINTDRLERAGDQFSHHDFASYIERAKNE